MNSGREASRPYKPSQTRKNRRAQNMRAQNNTQTKGDHTQNKTNKHPKISQININPRLKPTKYTGQPQITRQLKPSKNTETVKPNPQAAGSLEYQSNPNITPLGYLTLSGW